MTHQSPIRIIIPYIAALTMLFPLYAEEEGSPFKEFNKLKLGKVSGQVQFLWMGRDRNNSGEPNDNHGASTALTINYVSPEFEGLTLGVQYIHAEEMWEGGTNNQPHGAAYVLANDGYSLLNHAYLKYNFKHLDWKKSHVTVGRQTINENFARTYAIRHKAQAFEAIVLKLADMENLKVTLGHLERFSSWSSRKNVDTGTASNEFIDIADVMGVDYSTNGMQFIEVTTTAIPNTSINVYDYYGEDLFNTMGAKITHKIDKITLNVHAAMQRDDGRYDTDGNGDLSSEILELSVAYKDGGLSIEPGIMMVAGNSAEDNYQVPFRTSFVVDPTLMGYTSPFEGGSNTAFLKTVYKWDKNLFYMLYAITDHEEQTRDASLDQEIDFVVSRNFTKNFYVTIKVGFGHRDNGSSESNWQSDYRLFIGYKF